MHFSPAFQREYPELVTHIVQLMISVACDPAKSQVRRAFEDLSELTRQQVSTALITCSNPIVDFKVMPRANGQFNGSTDKHRVYLAKSICDRYKNNPRERNDPRMILLIESTLLHEMVHWGDWKDGSDQAGEEGKAFERKAYGGDVNRYW